MISISETVVQSCLATIVLSVHVCSMSQNQFCHFLVAILCTDHQHCIAIAIPRIHRETVVDGSLNLVISAISSLAHYRFHRVEKSIFFSCDGGPICKEKLLSV